MKQLGWAVPRRPLAACAARARAATRSLTARRLRRDSPVRSDAMPPHTNDPARRFSCGRGGETAKGPAPRVDTTWDVATPPRQSVEASQSPGEAKRSEVGPAWCKRQQHVRAYREQAMASSSLGRKAQNGVRVVNGGSGSSHGSSSSSSSSSRGGKRRGAGRLALTTLALLLASSVQLAAGKVVRGNVVLNNATTWAYLTKFSYSLGSGNFSLDVKASAVRDV